MRKHLKIDTQYILGEYILLQEQNRLCERA
jgi:hypothetical protein